MVVLKQIYFIITRRCNLFCSHCIRSSGPGLEDFLSFDQIKQALLKLSSSAYEAELLISGGEPTLHSDFIEVCKVASSLFSQVTINTNGLKEKTLLEASNLFPGKIAFQISIDGDKESHELIRGKGTFDRSLACAAKLAFTSNVFIATTVSDSNIHTIDKLDKELKDIDFYRWVLQRSVNYGRSALATRQLTTTEWNAFARSVIKNYLNAHRIKVSTMFDGQALSRNLQNKGATPKIRNCGTGTSKLYINPDLTVFPCGCLEEINLGNLLQDKIETILDRMSSLSIRPRDGSVCTKCPFLELCNGGCPGASYNYFGEFGLGDPRCPAVENS